MKVALIGLGYWGSKLLRNLVSHVGVGNIVAVDSHIDQAASASAQYPGLAVALSPSDALADPDVRAVLIATPTETHAALAREALLADRHVFVEKPLADSVEDAVELARLADRRGLRLMAGHTFLYSPRVQHIIRHLETGQAGPIYYATSSRLNLGRFRSDANVIWDLAPHDFAILFAVLGEAPQSVQTTAKSVVRPACPDIAFMNLTFPSGAVASVTVSWLAPRKVRNTILVGEQQMIVYDDTDPEEPIKIYNKGVALLEPSSFAANQLTYRYGDTIAPYVPVTEPLAEELRYFLGQVDNPDQPSSDAWFGVSVVMALDAADRSWRAGGEPVAVGRHDLRIAL